MRVLVALSGGVDSSVAAARLVDEGHDVVGATLKLWGGTSDSGCCSVADVDDARRVADALGVDHHTFGDVDAFETGVVGPYVEAHRRGRTPNPCVACNRIIKFGLLADRARRLGFDAVATGHHARVVSTSGGRRVGRGADRVKDQSYVVAGLTSAALAEVLFPVGSLTKAEVRAEAARRGLRTAAKPESQDVCFIRRDEGRASFLGRRLVPTPGRVVDRDGTELGRVDAVELVTVGQRRGLGLAGGTAPRYVLGVDVEEATVVVGDEADLRVPSQPITDLGWAGPPATGPVGVQVSAHGRALPARVVAPDGDGGARVVWDEPQRRVAAGQVVVVYRDDLVVGWATAATPLSPRW